MYEVMIADDEEIIRRGLAGFVRKDPDFHVAALAEDGEMALEMAQKQALDLVFVDINMPFMNGLSFVEKLLAFQPDVIVVIVTGYDDFQFVQQALRLGAADYLLKPVMEQPFYQLLERLKQQLLCKHQRKKYLTWAEDQLNRNRAAMTDNVFSRWMERHLDEAEFLNYADYLGIHFPPNYALTVIRLQEEHDLNIDSGVLEEELLYYACQNIAQEIFDTHSQNFCFHYHGALILICEALERTVWMELMQKVQQPMRDYFCVCIHADFAIGRSIAAIPELFVRVEEAIRSQQQYSDIVQRAILYAEKNFSDSSLGVQTIAEALHISQQYLSRTFRQETGDTFGAYLSQLRIRKAVELLRDPKIKMFEVAVRSGYTSQHYFSSAFKKILGVSPAEYQKNIQKGR